MEDWRVLVFLYLYEAGVAGFCALALLGLRVPFRRLALVSGTCGLAAYFFRSLCSAAGLPFGVHTFLVMMAYVISFSLLGGLGWACSLAVTFFSLLLIALAEACVSFPVARTLGVTVARALSSPWLHVAFGWLSLLPLLLLGGLCRSLRFSLADLQEVLRGYSRPRGSEKEKNRISGR